MRWAAMDYLGVAVLPHSTTCVLTFTMANSAYLLILLSLLYVYFLNKRLHGPHPKAKKRKAPTPEELNKVSYKDINMLDSIPSEATNKQYVVVGGSGFVGL